MAIMENLPSAAIKCHSPSDSRKRPSFYTQIASKVRLLGLIARISPQMPPFSMIIRTLDAICAQNRHAFREWRARNRHRERA